LPVPPEKAVVGRKPGEELPSILLHGLFLLFDTEKVVENKIGAPFGLMVRFVRRHNR
jgi:hypothetical protein